MSPIILFFILTLLVVLVYIFKTEKQIRRASFSLATLAGIYSLFLVIPVLIDSTRKIENYWWRIDGFSALMALLVAFIYVMANAVSIRYIGHEYNDKFITLKDYKLYFMLLPVFAICMLASVFTNNSILLWIALEGTTLSSTFLVGLYRRKKSIEAAWKYIVLCTTGISLGFVGILLFSFGLNLGGANENIFTLSYMAENAKHIPIDIVRWAFVFIFVGFGVKIGFVPMHNWLPDAHSKAPSPVSAIFSGILLNVAFYSLIRFKFITDTALGSSIWSDKMFLIFGVISIVFSAFLIFVQRNYKRMLAYSSIEHMGLISFALAFPPLGVFASVVHMVGHALTKSMLFFGAGEFLINWKSTKVDNIKNALRKTPYSAIFFLIGILMIVALPPSILFVSEYAMFAASIRSSILLSLLVLVTLSVIAFSMLKLTIEMIFSKQDIESSENNYREKWNVTHTVMSLHLVIIVVFFFWVSSPVGISFINEITKDSIYYINN